MSFASRVSVLLLFGSVCVNLVAQSAADQKTLDDLRTATKQMSMEGDGAAPFRLTATYEAFDFMGRPESQGRWTEEFASTAARKREVHDSNGPENYAPEDQAAIGAPAPATAGGAFMQRLMIDDFLHPGPSETMLAADKATFKTQKIGTISLRCVVLEPKEKAANRYMQIMSSRAYCLAQDAPILRMVQGAFGMVATYNNLTRLGDRMFAKEITVQQRGHVRGKLHVAQVVSAPELTTANLPRQNDAPELDSDHSGATKLASGVTAGAIVTKVNPIYPEEAKQKHISGSVVLHAIISKEGTIESLEVISAPADSLAESAIEAVSQWRYKPYLLNGQPTEVDTTITVHYNFG